MRPVVVPLLSLIFVSSALKAELASIPGRPASGTLLKWMPKKQAPAQVRAFERLDQDNDEALSLAELLEVTASLDGGFAQTNAIIHAWFDADDSGGIDLGEWQDGRAGNGNPDAPDLNGTAFQELDANGNGKVARNEFWKVVTRYVPAAVAREWYAAQFPGGQVTGSTSFSGGTLYLGGGLGIIPVGGLGTIGGVTSQWATLEPGASGTWLANLPARDLTLSTGIIESRYMSDPSVVGMILSGSFTLTADSEGSTEQQTSGSGSRDTTGEP